MIYKPYNIIQTLEIKELYSLFMQHFTTGYTFTGEIHNFWECVYVIEGELCVSSNEKVYNLQKGDIVFHKPQEFHKFNVENVNGATALIFSFTLDGFVSEKLERKVCSLTDTQRSIMNMFISYLNSEFHDHPEAKDSKYFYNVLPIFKKDPIFLHMVRLYILQLILYISKNEIPIETVETDETLLLKKAIDKMNDCIETTLSISDLASSLNISLSSLKRVFKKYTGMSVYKYYLTLKTRAATAMLQSGMTTSEVANRLGFSSPAYFSDAYKREAGKRPSKDILTPHIKQDKKT